MKRIYLKRPNRLTSTIELIRLTITKANLADSHIRILDHSIVYSNKGYEKDTRTSNPREPPIENSSNWRPTEAFFSWILKL